MDKNTGRFLGNVYHCVARFISRVRSERAKLLDNGKIVMFFFENNFVRWQPALKTLPREISTSAGRTYHAKIHFIYFYSLLSCRNLELNEVQATGGHTKR